MLIVAVGTSSLHIPTRSPTPSKGKLPVNIKSVTNVADNFSHIRYKGQ